MVDELGLEYGRPCAHDVGFCPTSEATCPLCLRERLGRLQALAAAVARDVFCPDCERIYGRKEQMNAAWLHCEMCGKRMSDDVLVRALEVCVSAGDVPGWPKAVEEDDSGVEDGT